MRNSFTVSSTVLFPRRGGELFVSIDSQPSTLGSLQSDLNAAANIGLKALTDPDWPGGWWFVLINLASGQPIPEKVAGCPVWDNFVTLLQPAQEATATTSGKTSRNKKTSDHRPKQESYAWNPLHWHPSDVKNWLATKSYWDAAETAVSERLATEQTVLDSPF